MSSLRTVIPGLGSSGSLLAAIVVAFIAVGAFVAFKGLPGGTAGTSDGTVVIDSTAPEAAAFAATASDAAPAADPEPLTAAVLADLGLGGGGGSGSGSGPGSGTAGGGSPGGAEVPGPGPGGTPGPGPGPAPPPSAGGTVGDLVGAADGAVRESAGVDLGLGEATKPITDLVDGTLKSVTGGSKGGLESITGGGERQLPGLLPGG